MTSHRPTCEYCGEQFEDAEAYTQHHESVHGEVASPVEQEYGKVRERPEGPGVPSQTERLVGYGEVEDDHGETEAYEPEDREVHRPPTPGPRDPS